MIARTFDELKIRNILLTDDIREWVGIDGVDLNTCDLKVRDVLYLLSDAGLFAAKHLEGYMWSFHACVYPEYRGKSYPYIREAITWVFDNTSAVKVLGFVRRDNERALKAAIKVGFKLEGILTNSFPLNGVLHDQYVLGIGR